MKKQGYQTPEWEIIQHVLQDIITTSGSVLPKNEVEFGFKEFEF